MKQIPVTDLRPGMVTAEDILTYDLKMIVPKGVVLTENIISRLESYSVYYVHIEDTVVNELNTPMTLSKVLDADAVQTNKEKIRSSLQFQHFQQDFNRCAEHFRDNLMKSLYRNEPFYVNGLLEETIQMMHQEDSYINVFDMLLNMRNVDDSVYNHRDRKSVV